MFTATETVLVRRTQIYLIAPWLESNTAWLGNDIAAFADRDFRHAFAAPVEVQCHFPRLNPSTFEHRIRGHVQVSDVYLVSTMTSVAVAVSAAVVLAMVRCHDRRHHGQQRGAQESRQQSCFAPVHNRLLMRL